MGRDRQGISWEKLSILSTPLPKLRREAGGLGRRAEVQARKTLCSVCALPNAKTFDDPFAYERAHWAVLLHLSLTLIPWPLLTTPQLQGRYVDGSSQADGRSLAIG